MEEKSPVAQIESMAVDGRRLRVEFVQLVDRYAHRLVVIEAEHMCMSMRGIQKTGASTTTCQFTGVFRDDPAEQVRFFTMLNTRRG